MASPVVVSRTESNEIADVTTHNIARVAGVNGQLTILIFAFDGGSNVVITPASGYTEFFRQDDGTAYGVAGFYHQEDGTEGTNVDFTTDDLEKSASIVYSLSGAEDPATQVPDATSTTQASTLNPDPPSHTPAGGSKDYLFIAGFAHDGEEVDDDTWCTAAPTNYTNLLQKTTSNAGTPATNASLATAERALTASVEDPATFTTIVTHLAAPFTIAVHPPVVPLAVEVLIAAGYSTFQGMTEALVAEELTEYYGDVATDFIFAEEPSEPLEPLIAAGYLAPDVDFTVDEYPQDVALEVPPLEEEASPPEANAALDIWLLNLETHFPPEFWPWEQGPETLVLGEPTELEKSGTDTLSVTVTDSAVVQQVEGVEQLIAAHYTTFQGTVEALFPDELTVEDRGNVDTAPLIVADASISASDTLTVTITDVASVDTGQTEVLIAAQPVFPSTEALFLDVLTEYYGNTDTVIVTAEIEIAASDTLAVTVADQGVVDTGVTFTYGVRMT